MVLMRQIFLSILILCSPALAQEVYKEVGEDGVPVFSDQGPASSKPVKIRETVTFSDPMAKQRIQASRAEAEARQVATFYQLTIVAPASGTALRENAGNLTLKVKVEPSPQPGHRIDLIMDGKAIRQVLGSGDIALTSLDRGTHEFALRASDEDGKAIAESDVSTITVLRHSKLHSRPGGAP
jgi:hypothetical protein